MMNRYAGLGNLGSGGMGTLKLKNLPQSVEQFVAGAMSLISGFAAEGANEVMVSKPESMFDMAKYILVGVDLVQEEFNKDYLKFYKNDINKLVNMFREGVYNKGLAVTEVVLLAAKFFISLSNALPSDNKACSVLKKFAGTFGDTLNIVSGNLDTALQRKVESLIKEIGAKQNLLPAFKL
ncbi:MAG: hypothetical protein LBL17_01700 [Coxiellaceae bacterium]|jgi:hypothetical protein|nr:hypothetical protein [Coxiellaceae bacterium]